MYLTKKHNPFHQRELAEYGGHKGFRARGFHTPTSSYRIGDPPEDLGRVPPAEPTTKKATRYLWAVTRLCISWIFRWPFLDKLFGLSHETTSTHAWINGESPTLGFLSGSVGPFAGIFQAIAGAGWLSIIGLLGIAVALLLGIGMRVAAVSGTSTSRISS